MNQFGAIKLVSLLYVISSVMKALLPKCIEILAKLVLF